MAIQLTYPIGRGYPTTQDYNAHVASAKRQGCCSKPATGCRCYYYGGIDWGCPMNTPVYAAADGVVEARVETSGYGKHIRLTHSGGYVTIYGHLSSLNRLTGNRVKQGDLIGYSGSTGNSTGPHLHFELRKNGVPEDPAPYLTDKPTPSEDWSDLPASPTVPLVEVTADPWVRIRKEPAGAIVGNLRTGRRVYALAYKQGWIQTEYGWVSADWLKKV